MSSMPEHEAVRERRALQRAGVHTFAERRDANEHARFMADRQAAIDAWRERRRATRSTDPKGA